MGKLAVWVVAILVVAAIGYGAWLRAYYVRLFSAAHIDEVQRSLAPILAAPVHAAGRPGRAGADGNWEYPPLRTSSGLVFLVSRDARDATMVVSFSQADRHTSRALGRHFGSLVAAMLRGNTMRLDPVVSARSGAHYLVFDSVPPTLRITPADRVREAMAEADRTDAWLEFREVDMGEAEPGSGFGGGNLAAQ